MKSKLILCLVFVLSGGLFGCSTTASHSAGEPKIYTNLTMDLDTGLPTDHGEKIRVLTPLAERKLRDRLAKIDSLLAQAVHGYWKNVTLGRPNPEDYRRANDAKTIFNIYHGGSEGVTSGAIDLDHEDWSISVRSYFQECAEKLKEEEPRRKIPMQSIFHQTLEGTDIVIDVEVATKDKVFLEVLRNKLNN